MAAHSNSAMRDFSALPPELWHYVLNSLESSDILNVLKTCRVLKPVAEVHLHSDIYWAWDHSKSKGAPIDQLLLNIVSRPELAFYARSFRIEEFGYGLKPRLPGLDPFSAVERGIVRDLIHDAGLANPEEWIERLQARDAETIVALILLQLCNLRSLDIDMFHTCTDSSMAIQENPTPLGAVIRSAVACPLSPRITKLAYLTHFSWPSEGYSSDNMALINRGELDDMLPVLRLPRLEEVSLKLSPPAEGSETDVSSRNPWLKDGPQSSSTLTKLSLRFTTVHERSFVKLLAPFANLRKVELELYRDSEYTCLSGSSIRNALLPSQETLEYLSIKYQLYDGPSELDGLFWESLGSLKSFTALKYLKAPARSLLNLEDDSDSEHPSLWSEILPPNLEIMDLNDTGWNLNVDEGYIALLQWEDLLLGRVIHTPNLRLVRVALDVDERMRQAILVTGPDDGMEVEFYDPFE